MTSEKLKMILKTSLARLLDMETTVCKYTVKCVLFPSRPWSWEPKGSRAQLEEAPTGSPLDFKSSHKHDSCKECKIKRCFCKPWAPLAVSLPSNSWNTFSFIYVWFLGFFWRMAGISTTREGRRCRWCREEWKLNHTTYCFLLHLYLSLNQRAEGQGHWGH